MWRFKRIEPIGSCRAGQRIGSRMAALEIQRLNSFRILP